MRMRFQNARHDRRPLHVRKQCKGGVAQDSCASAPELREPHQTVDIPTYRCDIEDAAYPRGASAPPKYTIPHLRLGAANPLSLLFSDLDSELQCVFGPPDRAFVECWVGFNVWFTALVASPSTTETILRSESTSFAVSQSLLLMGLPLSADDVGGDDVAEIVFDAAVEVVVGSCVGVLDTTKVRQVCG